MRLFVRRMSLAVSYYPKLIVFLFIPDDCVHVLPPGAGVLRRSGMGTTLQVPQRACAGRAFPASQLRGRFREQSQEVRLFALASCFAPPSQTGWSVFERTRPWRPIENQNTSTLVCFHNLKSEHRF